MWNDRTYKITSLPSELQVSNTILFHGPHKFSQSGLVISVDTTAASTIYVAVSSGDRDSGFSTSLPNMGWTTLSEGLGGSVPLSKVMGKTVSGGSMTTSFPALSGTFMACIFVV